MPTVAKNIKEAIAETEKNKNNLTQAKIKIDNKLVSLGGQSATDLSDVPNKIGQITNNLFKRADFNDIWRKTYPYPGTFSERIEFPVSFKPDLIGFYYRVHENDRNFYHDTAWNYGYVFKHVLGNVIIDDLSFKSESNKAVITFNIQTKITNTELLFEKVIIVGK